MALLLHLRPSLSDRRMGLWAVGVAFLLALPTLFAGRVMDDHYARVAFGQTPYTEIMFTAPMRLFSFADGDPERAAMLRDLGAFPWYTPDGLRLNFLRPVTVRTHWLDYLLWPEWPSLMHLHSVLWYAALVGAAAFLYRGLHGAGLTAGLAALLFAVDEAHGVPVGWLANRNALVAGAFGVLAIGAYDRWRSQGWRPGAVAAPALWLAGLLAGEMAVAGGAYLFAYALFVDRARPARRWLALVPSAAVGAGWWIAYSRLGYGAWGSGVYIDPARSPLRFLIAASERAPILLANQWGSFPGEVYATGSIGFRRFQLALAAGFVLVLVAALGPLLRANPKARFWALGMALSLAPVSATFPSSRLLIFVGLGGAGLLAQFLSGVADGEPWLPVSGLWRRGARWAASYWILICLLLSGPLFLMTAYSMLATSSDIDPNPADFGDDPALADQTLVVVNAPAEFLASMIPIQRWFAGMTPPARTLALAPGSQRVTLTRTAERSLLVRPRAGYYPPVGTPIEGGERPEPLIHPVRVMQMFSRLFRDSQLPMTLGEQVRLSSATVQVTALTADGRPGEVEFTFQVPLEHHSLRWYKHEAGRYVPFTPPLLGQSVRLERMRMAPFDTLD